MWQTVGTISTGIALAAFLVAAITTILRRRLVHTEKLIQSAPESERSKLVLAELENFPIDTADMTKQQRYELVLEQIKRRAERFKINAAIIIVVAVLASILAGVALLVLEERDNSTATEYSVQVVDKATNRPVPEALIEFFPLTSIRCVTDRKGRFTFAVPSTFIGRLTIRISEERYDTLEVSVPVDSLFMLRVLFLDDTGVYGQTSSK